MCYIYNYIGWCYTFNLECPQTITRKRLGLQAMCYWDKGAPCRGKASEGLQVTGGACLWRGPWCPKLLLSLSLPDHEMRGFFYHVYIHYHNPKVMVSAHHRLTPVRLWAKINLFSLQYVYLRHFAIVMRSWLTQLDTHLVEIEFVSNKKRYWHWKMPTCFVPCFG